MSECLHYPVTACEEFGPYHRSSKIIVVMAYDPIPRLSKRSSSKRRFCHIPWLYVQKHDVQKHPPLHPLFSVVNLEAEEGKEDRDLVIEGEALPVPMFWTWKLTT